MEAMTLNAEPRAIKGRKNYQTRAEGKIPAVVYGAGVKEPVNVSVPYGEFVKLYREAGRSTVISLSLGGQETDVIVQDIQTDPLRGDVIHIDFRAPAMDKPIEAKAQLVFTGESPAVKGLGGTLSRPIDTLVIKALPKQLVARIEVDLATLVTFDDAIRVSDLSVPDGVTIEEKPERVVASVAPPRTAAEMAALDEPVAGEEVPEGAEEKKEGEEGEEAAEGGEEKTEEAKKEE